MGRTRRLLRGGLGVGAAAVVALLVHLGYLALSGNFHPVIADELYRSAQVSKADIADYRARYGIRSILNLRGASPGQPWYDEEVAASAALGITHADFAMNASVPLSEAEADRLITLMRDLPKPLLVHRRHGADRTGLAMSLYLAAISGPMSFRRVGSCADAAAQRLTPSPSGTSFVLRIACTPRIGVTRSNDRRRRRDRGRAPAA